MILVKADWSEELAKRLRDETGETVTVNQDPSDALLANIDILLGFGCDEILLTRCPQLKLFYSLSAGVERLPFAALRKRQITVANASGAHGAQMSEQIIGVMIGFSRNLFLNRDNQNRHVWQRFQQIGELNGSTLLIIGAGRIGQAVAKCAKAFGMRVIGLKNHPAPLPDFDDVQSTDSLHALLPQADYVVLLTPLTPATRELMDATAFAKMKQTAVFLNYSRGGTVDEQALIHALQTGGIRGAGLDVFQKEPLETDSPLWSMPNVMLTPHSGGNSTQYDQRTLDVFLQTYRAWKAGAPIPTQIDLSRGY
ncbi:MAG: D-2-hydroxyacid dehydrogenase [Ethanoligenens sp.]